MTFLPFAVPSEKYRETGRDVKGERGTWRVPLFP
jgi:hypothetical protein